MITEFDAPPETPLADLPAKFVPPADQSAEIADWPLQVINEDSLAVIVGGCSGANEDDEVVQIKNSTSTLSSEDHPPSHPN